jgi:hypothetical protein
MTPYGSLDPTNKKIFLPPVNQGMFEIYGIPSEGWEILFDRAEMNDVSLA